MNDTANSPITTDGRRRRLLFRLRRATRVLEQRERLQDVGLGLLAAAFALALPATTPLTTGNEALLRMSGETTITQGLVYPLGRGAMEVSPGTSPEEAMRLLAGITFGVAIALTLAFLRNLGFRRTATVPATFAAFASPFAWLGGTSPVDYAPGIFGASLLLWSLFHQEQTTRRGTTGGRSSTLASRTCCTWRSRSSSPLWPGPFAVTPSTAAKRKPTSWRS